MIGRSDREAERAHRASEALIERLLRSLDEGVVVLDRHLRIVHWNPFMEALRNMRAEQVLGKRPHDVFPVLASTRTPDALRRALAGESTTLPEMLEYPQPDGSVRYGMVRIGPLREDGGAIHGVIVVVREVTEQRRAEEIVRRTEGVLEALSVAAGLLPNMPIEESAGQVASALGQSVGASRAYVYEYVGSEGQNAFRIAEWCADGIEPDPAGPVVATQGTIWALEYRTLRSGRHLQGLVRTMPPPTRQLLRAAGIVSLVVAPIFVDGAFWGEVGFDDCLSERTWSPIEIETLFTAAQVIGSAVERERRETDLRRRDAILRAVSAAARLLLERPLDDCAPDVLEGLGTAVEANRAYIYGFEDTEGGRVARRRHAWCAPGTTSHGYDHVGVPNDGHASWYEALQGGEAIAGIVGQVPWAARLLGTDVLSLVAVPVFAEGELWGAIGFDDCETQREWTAAELDALSTAAKVIGAAVERQRTEEALRRSEEMLRQSQRMEAVGRLAGGIAHDFNNLLTVITGYLGLVLDALEPDHAARADVEQVSIAAERAVRLTGQLLAFTGRQVLQTQPLDLNDVVGETETMLRRVIGADVELVPSFAHDPVHVDADPIQLQQILVNLAVNARDAMPRGGRLSLAVAAETVSQPRPGSPDDVPSGRYAVIRVSDTGVGMDAETRSRAFEPFFTTKPPGQGTGLGLATVYGIVKQSGGQIVLECEPGCGATFAVYLPVLEVSGEAVPAAPVRPHVRGRGTILVAEDEDALRALVVTLLERAGYTVLPARDGAEALSLARSHGCPLDLLLTDVVMSRMSGHELATALRAERPDLPVLFVTGYARGELADGGAAEAAMLQKPFTAEALEDAVLGALSASSAR